LEIPQKISARKRKETTPSSRICQADIFQDIEVIENVSVKSNKLFVYNLSFPFIICLNQECDLEQDYRLREEGSNKARMLHCLVAPVFLTESFFSGDHWSSDIFAQSDGIGRRAHKRYRDNEVPRYHNLKFPDPELPELIIDFKHFFTVNTDYLYSKVNQRMCSMDDLFREQISQRFSFYLSRIGLPEHN
jgi:hypothetical protein